MINHKNDHKRLPSLRTMIKGLEEEFQDFEKSDGLTAAGVLNITGAKTAQKNDVVGNVAVKKDRLRSRLLQLYSHYLDEYNSALDEIESIGDPETRAVMLWRYMYGLDWNQVARRMGAGYSPDSVKQRASRYLRNTNCAMESLKNVRE